MPRRNNEDRVGAAQPDASPPPPRAKTEDDFLSFVTPTEFVELPSGGRHYPEGNPLHSVDSIEIRHMTAKEEDILTSQSLLKKGIVIDRLLESLLVDKSIKVDDLLIGDKNAILIAARISGFGAQYITSVTCPQCTTMGEQEFDLDELRVGDEPPVLPEGVTETDHGTYLIKLPTLKVNVEVKLLTSADEKRLTAVKDRKRKMKLPESNYTDNLKSILVSVEGRDDDSSLQKLLEVMPLRDSTYLMKTYQSVVPNLNTELLFSCEMCHHEGGIELPFTADFFWPDA